MNTRWRIAQAAEIRWWHNYLKHKPKADYLLWKKQYWNNLLSKMDLHFKDKELILDAGCGPAGIFMALESHQVEAVDPLLDRYESTLKHFDKSNYAYTKFFNLPLEQFQPSYQFDKVFCLNAINHVADLKQCLDNLVALTKDGGDLILSIDAHNYQAFKIIFRAIPGDILHPHQYDLKEYEKMLTQRGCTIRKTELIKKEFFFNYYMLVAKVEKRGMDVKF